MGVKGSPWSLPQRSAAVCGIDARFGCVGLRCQWGVTMDVGAAAEDAELEM